MTGIGGSIGAGGVAGIIGQFAHVPAGQTRQEGIAAAVAQHPIAEVRRGTPHSAELPALATTITGGRTVRHFELISFLATIGDKAYFKRL